jgi:tRNA(Ile)-lysidine synthase
LLSTDLTALVASKWQQIPPPTRHVRVGLSGGLDSTVLLHLLAGLRHSLGLSLTAAHVRHGLVPGAEAWADVCGRLCAALDVPFAVCDVHVDRRHPGGLEAAAREVRRAALAGLGDGLLALAHHRDDQAETVLFRAIRGAGVRGAGGMPAFSPGAGMDGIWRPLLGVPRRDLLAYAREHALSWVEDPSNADCSFSRNFLRNEVLPLVEERFPGAASGLARMGRLCGEASGLLEELAGLDLAAMTLAGSSRLRRAPALSLSSARLRNLLRSLLEKAGETMPDEDRLREIERQFRESGAAEGTQMHVGKTAICIYRDSWWLEAASFASCPASQVWAGDCSVNWAGGVVSLNPDVGQGIAAGALRGHLLELRARSGGERMRLHAGAPSRSLKNLLQEAAIPPWRRASLPLLWIGGELAWIAGVGVADAFRCPPEEPGLIPAWSGLV